VTVWDSKVMGGECSHRCFARQAFCNVKSRGEEVVIPSRSPSSHSQTDESGESLTLTQTALAFFLVCIHKTTHAKIQRPASASLSSASMRLRGRFVWMLTRRS